MTEEEWLDRGAPFWQLLDHVRRQGGRNSTGAWARQLRLFACACARQVWLLSQGRPVEECAPAWRQAADVAERAADGLATREQLDEVRRANPPRATLRTAADVAGYAAHCLCDDDPAEAAWATSALAVYALRTGGSQKPWGLVLQEQVALCRDVFGNPFRAARVERSWLAWNDACVARMAQGIHEERAYDRVPILHDALLDAGCDDEAILSHCRAPGPHVRGCWAIDLILGKG
jgi:hypothetical protein